ncbi:MAG: tRNA dihydrouridine synthase DusB [Planctomycetes bacterium]|nr:tRNA dihydrouridine synthase DusB [Planctomycetota bacterium]MCB9910467.1 tRNA dihydrouridine synthase DusB [Planctomycetota bacterium]MCB9912593.1 tRNA dihydrouridine synthase DusB [Planctomycetota bacterium]HPF14373.1 tRNA dihydrouridine synthase DusB [Planctomycetota bacterium]
MDSQPPQARVVSELNANVPLAQPGEFGPLPIGPLSVWPPVVLAPMAGVTNLPFRALCREYGAGLYVSEMITARGFLMGNRLSVLLASSDPSESPRSVQVYGSDPKDLGEMVRALVDQGVDHLDINFGCPVPKVTRSGNGSAIPVKPKLMARLVSAMVKNAGEVPVTVKMRKGIDEQLLTFLDAGRVAQEEGAAAVGLHGRTAAQLYSGEADWDAIGELKATVSIPVLGNGDIWEAWDALRMMRHTGCDGVIVGRGCLGRPWLFRELAQVFAGQEPAAPPTLGEAVDVMVRHAERLVDFFGEAIGMRQMRKWVAWYSKGFHGSAALRGRMAELQRLDQLRPLFAELDLSEPFPAKALRIGRAKGNKQQRVKLPEGFLDNRDDDSPPKGPHTLAEIEAWEQALQGG